jgi:hypothetical protein
MLRYRLRTLLILLAVGPPMLGRLVWPEVEARYRAWQIQRQRDSIEPAGGGLRLISDGRYPVTEGGGLIEVPVEE